MNKHSEHKYVVDSLDTPVSTTEPTPDTTDQAVTPPAMPAWCTLRFFGFPAF